MTTPTMVIADAVIGDTVQWLERAVIGLNLCPFAKAPYAKRQIHFAVSEAVSTSQLRSDLMRELQALAAARVEERETSLLIIPRLLRNFHDYNDFLGVADVVLEELGLEGEIQIASFHPDYQFGDAEPDAITNYTNRAPYPTLHLLREASIDRAVKAFPDAEDIFGANMRVMEKLGLAGWLALNVGPSGKF